MGVPVLIISFPTDIHAFAVAEALRRKGGAPLIWCSPDFPTRSGETIRYDSTGRNLRVRAPNLELSSGEFFSVWHRRLVSAPDRTLLHPSDRAFASLQCETFRRGMLETVSPGAFWVNPPLASQLASQKIHQFYEAYLSGLSLPETIFSNDPDEIRRFIREAGGRAVFKSLTPASWKDDEDRCWTPYTVSISEADLVEDNLLRQTPAIFQVEVPKAYEVRMTVMGREIFLAKIHSQDTEKGRLDWRLAYDELRMEPAEVPDDVADKCFLLMQRLGIVFGCFDFIITPGGDWIYLEVNEMGQFLFLENYTGMPLLDVFSDFLLSGQPDFRWVRRGVEVRFPDVQAAARDAMLARAQDHVQVDLLSRYYEGDRPEGS